MDEKVKDICVRITKNVENNGYNGFEVNIAKNSGDLIFLS